MNDKDEKAFEDWYGDKPKNYASLYLQNKKAWQAACEYKREEYSNIMDAITQTSQYNFKLQAENKKLREALEKILNDYRTFCYYLDWEEIRDIAREALKEVREE